MTSFATRVATRELRLGVIGLGYVGLPVATTFANAGFAVLGLDRLEARIAQIARGESPIEGHEPGFEEALRAAVTSRRLTVTSHASDLEDARPEVILIAVETPVEADHRPRYAALESAVRAATRAVAPGGIVIVESTLAPGTMDRRVKPWIDQARGEKPVRHGHCPERVMPGKLLHNLRTMSRVCGGDDLETASRMCALYRTIVEGELDPSRCVTAELTKTAENAYRDVQIAFANELAQLCEHAGADFLEVRSLVNKSPGRAVLMAGTGVGGHCIPKDPWLLLAALPESESMDGRLLAAARRVNDAMPSHVARMTLGLLEEHDIEPHGAHVTVLGYAYLEDSDDERLTPSEPLVRELRSAGCEVRIHDPFIARFAAPIEEACAGADALVLAVAHRAYRALDWAALRQVMRHPLLVDGRFVTEPASLRAIGWATRGIGR